MALFYSLALLIVYSIENVIMHLLNIILKKIYKLFEETKVLNKK